MKKFKLIILIILIVIIQFSRANAQKYQTIDSKTSFFSTTAIEDIEGISKETKGILDVAANTFFFKIPIKSFEFKSGLMRDHFNENYMESEKFPAATFKGKIDGNYDLTKDGFYMVKAIGEMTIHGEAQQVVLPVKMSVIGGKTAFESSFPIKLVDYKITIPTVVFNKIAEQLDVKVSASLELLK